MKYMGSKRALLTNGLGETLNREVKGAKRFVDMFLGTAEVAAYIAERHTIAVYGVDLQSYSVFLAESIIGRNRTVEWEELWSKWNDRARRRVRRFSLPKFQDSKTFTRAFVNECRIWCSSQSDEAPITGAYGGHYFSPIQAIWIDAYRATLPNAEPQRTLALASLIRASSQCAAAPGHTAQPFQPTKTAKPFLRESWSKDVRYQLKGILATVSSKKAIELGAARVGNANEIAEGLEKGDLVFLDPPYSGVQYSRFYHVLETIARGSCGVVSGIGRYPDQIHRPKSRYSLVSESALALDNLLGTISEKGARAILTFPDHECSNGLSGNDVRRIANSHFKVTEKIVASKFSTLGGRGGGGRDKVASRKARHIRKELVLILRPK